MSIITDKINLGEYIYSANTKWGLKKYVCDVAYFTEETLDDLYYVICSILDRNEEKCYHKQSLGILLGFSTTNQKSVEKNEIYYDVAEVQIFDDILTNVEHEHLIKIDDDNISLTNLGRISLKERKHYQFFTGSQDIYEHNALKSEDPEAMLMFPFYKDMGIYTSLKTREQIWPTDEDVENIIYSEKTKRSKQLELQSVTTANIYQANIQEFFDIETKIVPVKLFKYGEEYIPAIMNGKNVAIQATELINEELNSNRRENIILECLFQKLWDDRTAILDFHSLENYLDLVDCEELAKDSRTVWTDVPLFDFIVDRASSTCWRNITRHCDIDVLRNCIHKYKDKLDWPILTERIDDSYLLQHFIEYPWDLEELSEDINRKESVIEQLLLLEKDTEEDWNWEELGKRLSQEFVLSHLDIVKVDLTPYTQDSEEIRKAIVLHSDKHWDWNKVESDFNLQYIYDHITTLGSHLSFVLLFDRIFTNFNWTKKFASNKSFCDVIAQASKSGGILASSIFNDKAYCWTNEIIDLLTANDLICWESTPYMVGFECNPHLDWTKDFFDRYSGNVTTEEGRKYICSRINDINILTNTLDFDWDWDAISTNKSLLSETLLYTLYGSNLNWSLVLDNQTDALFLQSINDIESMIGDNKKAWSAYSAIASIDYVVKKYKECGYPWDWTILTKRMFQKLRLENLGNKLFVDQWDWTYISENVPVEFLKENLEKFSKYWNWQIALTRILTSDRKFDYDFLDKLAVILTNIPGNERCKNAWNALTTQYSFKELKKIIKETSRKRAYWWDINYFFQHKEFYIFRDLDDCRNFIDWKILSNSPNVDSCFKFNKKLGIKEKVWNNEVRKILTDERNHWNYASLSHFESLRNERWFISLFKDKLDWEYLSKSSNLFCTKDKQQLNEIVEAFKEYIDFQSISNRNDVDIEQILKINPRADYDYNKLIERGIIKDIFKAIEEHPNYSWNWSIVSSSDWFNPSAKFLLSHIDSNLNWNSLSKKENKWIWSDTSLICAVAQDKNIRDQIDWFTVSSLENFPINKQILDAVPKDRLNWSMLSTRQSIVPFVNEFKESIDWRLLSENRYFNILNLDILNKYKDYLHWDIICRRQEFVFSNEILDLFSEYIDWNVASASKNIKFSKKLVEKYKDQWNWPILVKNKAFNNTINIREIPYENQINIVNFISQFPKKPKAYHFTHMDNAIKILRSMKLQSRNYAEGNFSNSAGTNVHRTNKAHRFARFYFVPKSPTQFYNECLGKDKDCDYYKRAYNLGLPKCPLPVFFIFDIEELLTVMPDKCYYSNGNMQKDSSQSFKVITDPNRIKAREIYIDSYNTFDERQQEFLIDGELDFSKLHNVQICCYDDFQAEMLRKELKGSKWEHLINTYSNLFIHGNRELFFYDKNDSIKINTNYGCEFEFRISYSGSIPPTIINKDKVLRQRDHNIFMSSAIEIKKDVPFDAYFEVHNPRIGSWLIYRNK